MAEKKGTKVSVNDMVIKVSRVDASQTAEATEAVPFETLTTEDAGLAKGEKKVTQPGVAGTLNKSFKLVLVDGRERVGGVVDRGRHARKARPAPRGR